MEHFSENVKYGSFKKIVIYHKEKKGNNWTVFMVILSNKIIQNYHKITPKKGSK